jgi:hypothetical protein
LKAASGLVAVAVCLVVLARRRDGGCGGCGGGGGSSGGRDQPHDTEALDSNGGKSHSESNSLLDSFLVGLCVASVKESCCQSINQSINQ